MFLFERNFFHFGGVFFFFQNEANDAEVSHKLPVFLEHCEKDEEVSGVRFCCVWSPPRGRGVFSKDVDFHWF